jgi:hypothetical protein
LRRFKEQRSKNFWIPEGTKKDLFLYTNIVNIILMATSVYSIRIDSRVRKMIDELPGKECQEEIRALIENTVRARRRDLLLARAQKRTESMHAGVSAARIIREARDDR